MREATEKQAGSEAPVESPVDSKLQRIEELSQQIVRQDGRLDSFWQQLTERLSAAEVVTSTAKPRITVPSTQGTSASAKGGPDTLNFKNGVGLSGSSSFPLRPSIWIMMFSR